MTACHDVQMELEHVIILQMFYPNDLSLRIQN